jgi:transposase
VWQPPVECSRLEREVIKRVKRAKLFVWLREHRHELFDADFQAELAGMYQDKPVGQPPVPPAQLGLATILQAYTGASDDEVLEACVMDRRWQLVLDCMDHAQAPFSKTTLVAFRARLIAHGLDRRLVERTVELYGQLTGRVAGGKLRAALDSSPLWGAGRVEDTINLLGHALRKVVGVLARQQGWGLAEGTRVLAEQAGVPELAASSLKAALDLDWDDPAALPHALRVVLGAVGRVEQLAAELGGGSDPAVVRGLAAARQVQAQDTVVGHDGIVTLRQGVARDRRISIEDAQMRHGRKTKSVRVDGYKRHVLTDLDTELVPAVGVTPANVAEAQVAEQLTADLDAKASRLASWISTGRICPAAWSATALTTCRSSVRRSRSATGHGSPSRIYHGLRPRPAHLPQQRHHAVCPWRQGPVPGTDLPELLATRPVHLQHPGSQRAAPPRRAAAGGAARRAADPTRAGPTAPAGQGRAHPGPCRPLAG